MNISGDRPRRDVDCFSFHCSVIVSFLLALSWSREPVSFELTSIGQLISCLAVPGRTFERLLFWSFYS